jgi:hypothetical protein
MELLSQKELLFSRRRNAINRIELVAEVQVLRQRRALSCLSAMSSMFSLKTELVISRRRPNSRVRISFFDACTDLLAAIETLVPLNPTKRVGTVPRFRTGEIGKSYL